MVQIVNAEKLKHYVRNKVRFRCVNVNTLHKGYNKYNNNNNNNNNNNYYYYTVSWLWRFLIAVTAVAQAHS